MKALLWKALIIFSCVYVLFLLFISSKSNSISQQQEQEHNDPFKDLTPPTTTPTTANPTATANPIIMESRKHSLVVKLAKHLLSSFDISKEFTYGWYLEQLFKKESIGVHKFDPKVKEKLIQYGFGDSKTTAPNWFGFFRVYNQSYCRQTSCQIFPTQDSRSFYYNTSSTGTGIHLDANIEHYEYKDRGLGLEKIEQERKLQEEISHFLQFYNNLEEEETIEKISQKFDEEFALKAWLAMRPINVLLCNEANALSEMEPRKKDEQSHLDMTMCWSTKCSIWTTYFYSKLEFEFKESSKIPPHCICAFISNCVKERLDVVNEISTIVDVRQYGACGRNAKEDEGGKVVELAKSCKFYMAFENTLLNDYITEKFFEGFSPLKLGGKLISIYRGAFNINEFGFPRDSFINFHSFKSPTELAQHIKPYCDDDKKFDQYFRERMTESTRRGVQDISNKLHLANVIKSPCKLCTAIGEMKLSRYLLFKLGLKPKYYRAGIREFENFIKIMEYDQLLDIKQLNVLWDLYDRAYGRILRNDNNKTNWNDFHLNWKTYVTDQ